MPLFDENGQPLADSDLDTAVLEGRAALPAGQSVVVRDEAGNRIELDHDRAADALADYVGRGYSVETDAQRAEVENRLAAERSPIQAGAEALARGATLGLSDVAARSISPEYANQAALRRQELEGYGTGLELLGGIVPTLVTGGSATPAGFAARAAVSAGEAAEGALLRRGVGSGVARIAGMAAEGTLDGAIQGIGQQLSEDSLGDTEVTAQHLLASGGMGALLGIGTGGALGAAGVALSRGARGAADRAAARAAAAERGVLGDIASEGVDATEAAAVKDAGAFRYVPDELKEGFADYASRISGANRETLASAIDDAELRSQWLRQDEVRASLNKEFREAAQTVVDFDHVVRDVAAGEIKTANVERAIRKDAGASAEMLQSARSVLDPMYAQVDELEPLLSKKDLKALRSDLDVTSTRAGEAFARGNNAEGYVALENLKRAFDSRVKLLDGKLTGDLAQRQGQSRVLELARENGDKIRKLLEDETLFGDAGRMQRERNAALHEVIDTSKYFRALTEGTGSSLSPERWALEERVVDGEKTSHFLSDLTNPNRDNRIAQIRKHLEALDSRLYDTLEKNGERTLDDPLFAKARVGVKRALEVFDRATSTLKRIEDLNALDKLSNDAGSFLSPSTGAIAGGFIGGPIGAALGGVAGGVAQLVTKPGALLRRVTQLEALAQRIRGSQQSIAARTQRAVRRIITPGRIAAGAQRIGRTIALKTSNRLLLGDRQERQNKARGLEQRIRQFESDPQRFARAVGYQTRGMATEAPVATLAVAQQSMRAMQFLASKAPPSAPIPNRLQPSRQMQTWTAGDAERMAKYARAIAKPETVLADLEDGHVSPESIEAIKAVYPAIYGEMQQAAMQEVATAKGEMPYSSVVQLSVLFDFAGHPTLDPAFIRQHQQVMQEASALRITRRKQRLHPTHNRCSLVKLNLSLTASVWASNEHVC